MTIVGPNEWMIGAHPDAHHGLFESVVRVEWAGDIGWGYLERSIMGGRA